MRNAKQWVTGLLLFLGLSAAVVGTWAQFFPRSFYNSFPGLGRHWISVDGPFNEHLIRDVGGLNLALLALTVAALLRTSAILLRVTGVAWLVMEVPHLAYHGLHDVPDSSTVDRVLSQASLASIVIAAIAIVVLAEKLEHT